MANRVLITGHPIEVAASLRSDEWSKELVHFSAHWCGTPRDASELLKDRQVDCLIVIAPAADGELVAALERIRESDPDLPSIVLSREPTPAEVVRLVRAGAWNCFDLNDSSAGFSESIDEALELRRRLGYMSSRSDAKDERWRATLVGQSAAIESVAHMIRCIAPRRCTVLITGETGTGKEMAARAVHMASPRFRHQMVSVNCTALPDNLLEAELFGHTRGAFTGATGSRVGLVEQANRSTLFLDEIGDLPIDLQAKLLRVLQEREFHRLGSSEVIKVDIRVIAATNIDLHSRIAQGRFREDLYYRLNVVPLKMPALHARRSDIPSLVNHFIGKVCSSEEIPIKRLAPRALELLCGRDWPGNVRQLENVVEMAIAFSGDREILCPTDFGFAGCHPLAPTIGNPPVGADTGVGFQAAVDQFGVAMLESALAAEGGNKTRAAARLGMKRTTLLMKMRSMQQPKMLEAAG